MNDRLQEELWKFQRIFDHPVMSIPELSRKIDFLHWGKMNAFLKTPKIITRANIKDTFPCNTAIYKGIRCYLQKIADI